MADILIRGMEMPKDGVYWCEIGVAGEIATITIHGEDRKSFRLFSIPEGHGRLIDGDELFETMRFYRDHEELNDVMRGLDEAVGVVMHATTIVPAEGGGEDG